MPSIIYLSDAEAKGDRASMVTWIKAYDEAWSAYNQLPEQFSAVARLYTKDFRKHMKNNAANKVEELRAQ